MGAQKPTRKAILFIDEHYNGMLDEDVGFGRIARQNRGTSSNTKVAVMRRIWFGSAGTSFALCAYLVNADATRVGGDPYYSFWVSPLAVSVYVTAVIGVGGLICGIFNVRLTRRRFFLNEGALRRVREISVAPGYTEVEKQRFLAPYIGMWMQITGTVIDVEGWQGSSKRLKVLTCLPELIAFMYFSNNSRFRRYLSVLSGGMQVTVIGKIKRIEPDSISLVKCEIVLAS